MTDNGPTEKLAILDWGIGGMGLVKALRARGITKNLLYFSDSGFTPYGRVSKTILEARVRSWTEVAQSFGARHLVIACNAASSILENAENLNWEHRQGYALPMTGIIAHGIQQVLSHHVESIAVIGGQRTIRSNIYRRAFEAKGLRVYQRIAHPLSALVEMGQLRGAHVEAAIRRVLAPVPKHVPVLLACTHYPALMHTLRVLYPSRVWLDPASRLAEWLKPLDADGREFEVWTTGDPCATQNNAAQVFGVAPATVHTLPVSLS